MLRFLALLTLVLLGQTAARAEQPAEVNYLLHCMGCHLADGSGGAPDVPDIRGEMGCLLSVEGGREYLVQVPGASQAPISDAELAAVVNYLLETFNADTLPADYAPLTEDEVAKWRDDWLPDVAAERKELMARLGNDCRADRKDAEGS
jgi:mono/diheme cytochrome c family protein